MPEFIFCQNPMKIEECNRHFAIGMALLNKKSNRKKCKNLLQNVLDNYSFFHLSRILLKSIENVSRI